MEGVSWRRRVNLRRLLADIYIEDVGFWYIYMLICG